MRLIISLILVVFFNILNAQYVTISELTVLNQQIEETSGLIFFDGKLVTINDSGNPPFLYEIDTINGEILRTVTIENATNIDWESLAQDSLYIYIGDIGNNSGDRTDLKIYRINKSDYIINDSVMADTISFTYNNQTDFTSNYRDTEFDAEALTVYNDSLIIFMKDWVNNSTRTYVLPKMPGNYTAFERNAYNCNGLITGSDYNNTTNEFFLCGYTQYLAPFIVNLSDFTSNNVFSGTNTRINITDSIGASQVEGICYENNEFFLSRENFTYQSTVIEQMLFKGIYSGNSLIINSFDNLDMTIMPNPAHNYLSVNIDINRINNLQIFDTIGKKIKTKINNKIIDISGLKNGIYILILELNNTVKKYKFIKI